MCHKSMALISIMSDFYLGVGSLVIRPELTIKYDFMAPCSLFLTWFPWGSGDFMDALESFASLVIPTEQRSRGL